MVTASRIEAPVAIRGIGARLDIAGSRVHRQRAAVEASRASQVLFSLSDGTSPHHAGRMHGLWRVQPEEPAASRFELRVSGSADPWAWSRIGSPG
ncbi:MAG: hypothetical protein MZV65_18970 [Chromatiales bacterium]|nr:hypothetical protein [Chromatiales bacterium]